MPETIAEAKDTHNFVSALAREIASEGGSMTRLAEVVGNTGDLAEAEEKLLIRVQALWLLARKCSEWRTAEGQRLDEVAVRIADEINTK